MSTRHLFAWLTFDKFSLLLVGLALLGALLLLLRQINYGVGVSWDEAGYIERAQLMLAEPTGWIDWMSGQQPPLFPILLAFISSFGFDPAVAAGFVNATAFGLTVLVSGLWMRRRLESRLLTIWGVLAVMLSIPLVTVASRALTEPLFILFSLLALIQIHHFLDRRNPSSLILSAVFTALSCLTRYMGPAIAVSIILLLLFRRGASLPERFMQVGAYSFIALSPLCIWLLRNLRVTGSLTSNLTDDWAPSTSLAENIWYGLKALTAWVLPVSAMPVGIQDMFTILVGIVLLSAAMAGVYTLSRSHLGGRSWGDGEAIAVFGLFALVYSSLLMASGLFVEIGHANLSRYLAPVYVPLVVFVTVIVADRIVSKHSGLSDLLGGANGRSIMGTFQRRFARATSVGSISLFILFIWLVYPIATNVRLGAIHLNQGIEYTSAKWLNSPVIQYMNERHVSGWVYSNHSGPLTFLTGARTKDFRGIESLEASSPGYIVYFHDIEQADVVPAIRDLPYVEPVGQADVVPAIRDLPYIEPVLEEDVNGNITYFLDGYPTADPPTDFVRRPGANGMESPKGNIYRYRVSSESRISEVIQRVGVPIIRSNYDVYLDGNRLIYTKDEHVEDESDAHFFLHIVPMDTDDLPDHRKQYGFDNFDFGAEDCVSRSDGKCVLSVRIPEYDISEIRTGQFLPPHLGVPPEGIIWEGNYSRE